MLDPISLDQLRMFVTISEEGSFSAAARRIGRVQSAVSHAMASLESQLGVTLWDRTTRAATLTEQGRLLLAAAQRVCAEVDTLRKTAQGLEEGLEPSLSLSVDALFPLPVLVELCRDFSAHFPTVTLKVETETLSMVSMRVQEGCSHLGLAVGPVGLLPGLTTRHLASVQMLPVVAPEHPLAALASSPLDTERLAEHVQIVLSERTLEGIADQAVLSPHTWRVKDIHTKLHLLRAGLGWGNLPGHMLDEDLRSGRLLRIQPAAWGPEEHRLSLCTIHRADLSVGPATRWLFNRLDALGERGLQPAGHPSTPSI